MEEVIMLGCPVVRWFQHSLVTTQQSKAMCSDLVSGHCDICSQSRRHHLSLCWSTGHVVFLCVHGVMSVT